MRFQKRAKRWPSAWQLTLHYGVDLADSMVIEFRNVSASGCSYVGPVTLPIGTPVRFSVGTDDVNGRVVRRMRGGQAIAFATLLTRLQLENLRQVRSFSAIPKAAGDPAQSDEDLRRAISSIL
ncbi:MAG: hypothetical protein AAF280_01950 [Pseudomonadota bacterium]